MLIVGGSYSIFSPVRSYCPASSAKKQRCLECSSPSWRASAVQRSLLPGGTEMSEIGAEIVKRRKAKGWAREGLIVEGPDRAGQGPASDPHHRADRRRARRPAL